MVVPQCPFRVLRLVLLYCETDTAHNGCKLQVSLRYGWLRPWPPSELTELQPWEGRNLPRKSRGAGSEPLCMALPGILSYLHPKQAPPPESIQATSSRRCPPLSLVGLTQAARQLAVMPDSIRHVKDGFTPAVVIKWQMPMQSMPASTICVIRTFVQLQPAHANRRAWATQPWLLHNRHLRSN